MFLYTHLVRLAIDDIARTVPVFAHLKPRQIAVVAGARPCVTLTGNLAQCHALRLPEVEDVAYWYNRRTRHVVRMTPWARRENVRVRLNGQDMLYVILLRLPRLLNYHPLETIIHELVHIHQNFDGRIRRLRHGKRFDSVVEHAAAQWRREGDPALVRLVEMNAEMLAREKGPLVAETFGNSFATQRWVPFESPIPLDQHPDFARKGLVCKLPEVEILPGRWTTEKTPAELTERDVVYRLFRGASACKISPTLVHTGATQNTLNYPETQGVIIRNS
jgi:predicted metallopeptidase